MRSNCIPLHGLVLKWTHRLSIKVGFLWHVGHIHGLGRLQMGMLEILLLHSSHLRWVAHVKLWIHFLLLVQVRRLLLEHHLVILKLSECLHVKLWIRLVLICKLRIELRTLVYLEVRISSWYHLRWRMRILRLKRITSANLLEIMMLWRQIKSCSYLRVIRKITLSLIIVLFNDVCTLRDCLVTLKLLCMWLDLLRQKVTRTFIRRLCRRILLRRVLRLMLLTHL